MDMGMVTSEDLSHALYGQRSCDQPSPSRESEAGVHRGERVPAEGTVGGEEQP